ncbi:MAG: phosphoribosyltransferase [Candidatus Hodarchaeota archaeon]
MVLPDKFACKVMTWDEVYELCKELAKIVKTYKYNPDVVIGLSPGGWFPARVLADLLYIPELISLEIKQYNPLSYSHVVPPPVEIKYPIQEDSCKGKKVLIVDDLTDTGRNLEAGEKYVKKLMPSEIKTACLQFLYVSEAKPDYVAEFIHEWYWYIYPWRRHHDLTQLIYRIFKRNPQHSLTVNEIADQLKEYHELELSKGEVLEILTEMLHKGIISAKGDPIRRTILYMKPSEEPKIDI